MADNKKEQERAELHRTIWGIANDLRGSVDGWDFMWSKRTQEKLLILPSSTQKLKKLLQENKFCVMKYPLLLQI